jgi:hypothetical protein
MLKTLLDYLSKIFSVEGISGLYDSILKVIDFIVGRTSDTLADIMIRALPLLAPLPNAVSLFYISQHALKYNTVQALAVAAAMECMFFALTEVGLKMWDKAPTDERYVVPLRVVTSVFVLYFALVMALVYALEVKQGNYAPMAFPVVSVVAALTLGCERWHKRNMQGVQKAHKGTVQRTVQPVQSPVQSVHDRGVQTAQEPQGQIVIDAKTRARQLKSEGLKNAQIAEILQVHRNTVGAYLAGYTNGHSKPVNAS